MSMRDIAVHLPTTIPSLILSLAVLIAVMEGNRYLDGMEQADIRREDALHLSLLDSKQQRQYRDYREHRVSPDAAAQWVRGEQELTELKRSIQRHEMVTQAALSGESTSE